MKLSLPLSILLILVAINCVAQPQRLTATYIGSLSTPNTYGIDTYYYSQGRSSDHRNNIINFDSSNYRGVNTNIVTGKEFKYFDGNSRVVAHVKCDNPTGTSGNIRIYNVDSFRYDNAGRVIWQYQTNTFNEPFSNEYKYLYDANGNLVKSTRESFSGGTFYGTEEVTYKYDSQNNLVEKSSAGAIRYPAQIRKQVFTYNNNRLVREDILYYNNNIWDSVAYEEHSYSNNGDTVTSVFFAMDYLTKNALKATSRSISIYNNNADVSLVIWQRWDSTNMQFENSSRYSYSYNSLNQLDTSKQFNWDTVKKEWDLAEDAVYVYEEYDPNELRPVLEKGTLLIYPVPSADFITVQASQLSADKISLAIMDMRGNVVRILQDSTNGVYRRTVLLAGLPAGNYIIQLSAGKSTICKQFSKM